MVNLPDIEDDFHPFGNFWQNFSRKRESLKSKNVSQNVNIAKFINWTPVGVVAYQSLNEDFFGRNLIQKIFIQQQFSKIRSTNKLTHPELSIETLRSYCTQEKIFTNLLCFCRNYNKMEIDRTKMFSKS